MKLIIMLQEKSTSVGNNKLNNNKSNKLRYFFKFANIAAAFKQGSKK